MTEAHLKQYLKIGRMYGHQIVFTNGCFDLIHQGHLSLLCQAKDFGGKLVIGLNSDASIKKIKGEKNWIINYGKKIKEIDVNLMVVCQGKTIGELISTYQILVDLGYKHIAFNHSSIAYQDLFKNKESSLPEDKRILNYQMYGRMEFIRQLVQSKTIRNSYYHQLL